MKNKVITNPKGSVCLFLLVFIAYGIIYMTKNCYSAAMASIVSEGIMTKSETGLIAAAFYLVYAPFQIVGGIAADRYSPSKLIVIGTLGAAVCNLLIYFVDSYIGMLIIWSINAILQFGIWPSIFKIVTTQLLDRHRPQGIFYISMDGALGLVFSYICAAFITYWKDNFLFSAIILFITAILFVIIYARLEKDMVEENVMAEAEPKEEAKSSTGGAGLIIAAGIPLLMIVNMIHSMLNLGIKALAPTMLMESYAGLTPALANILNILLVLAGPVGLFLSVAPVFRNLKPTTSLAIFLAAILPMLLIVMFIGKIPLLAVMLALVMIMVFAGAMSIFFSYISRAFQSYGLVGTLSGLFNCMASLGVVLANYVFASLADNHGWEFTTRCWVIITAAALILALITLPVWKRFVAKYNIK